MSAIVVTYNVNHVDDDKNYDYFDRRWDIVDSTGFFLEGESAVYKNSNEVNDDKFGGKSDIDDYLTLILFICVCLISPTDQQTDGRTDSGL